MSASPRKFAKYASKKAGWALVALAAAMRLEPATSRAQESTIRLQKNTDARNFDPHKIISRSVGEILPFLLDTLVTVEDDLATLRPGLAQSWTMSPDGLTFTFKLKD